MEMFKNTDFQMRKYALTGGIGTGKTFISRDFILKGIPVFYADEEAKKLYAREDVIAQIRELFGDAVFTDNKLDFNKMAALIFANPEEQKRLESLIHPLVMEEFERWAAMQNADTVMMESAIIFEAHLEKYFDKVFVVNASVPVRVARIRRRNPELSEEQILARIAAQMPQEEKCRLADEIIEHEEDI